MLFILYNLELANGNTHTYAKIQGYQGTQGFIFEKSKTKYIKTKTNTKQGHNLY